MKLAIMQPYFFPYIGYFQLINAVDKFVVYDDVNFIKQGWINRNNILVGGKPSLFTVPLIGASSFKLIHEIPVGNLTHWNKSFFKTIEQNYKKAPHFEEVFNIIRQVLTSEPSNVADLCVDSIKQVINYLKLDTIITDSSRVYNNSNLRAQERVIDICLKEKATHYINPIGGMSLYSKDVFRQNNIQLNFIKTKQILYKQFNNDFVPSLSSIDVLMFNSPDKITEFLNQYDLL